MLQPNPATLGVSRVALRWLVVLNWIYGAAILVGLAASLVAEVPVMTALGVTPSVETEPLVRGMRVIAVLGLVSVPLHYVILRRLADIVERVSVCASFEPANASRLRTIAWSLLGLQLLSVAIGSVAGIVSTPAHPLDVDAGFSTAGWLAVLLLFVLARVFAEGTRMRDDLEGTV
ncbi:MAG: DUF2975 domain-containing protein [Woeseiaceae bacterium]